MTDTPPAQGANTGKPKFPHITCNNGPNGDMFMNYMDYVDDAAMFMFTTGQALRMSAALEGPRASFVVGAGAQTEQPLVVRGLVGAFCEGLVLVWRGGRFEP